MPRKAKPTKHSAKDLAARADAALTNRGGGKAGKAQRTDAALTYMCPICKLPSPSAKTMSTHWDSKHIKLGAFNEEACRVEVEKPKLSTKEKPGVRGSKK